MKRGLIDSVERFSEVDKSIKDKITHNTADTSKSVYRELVRSGQIKTEQELVYDYLKLNQPLTSRKIAYEMGKERGSVTRSLYNLNALGRIKIAYTAKCVVTAKTVCYYALVDWVSDSALQIAA